MTTLLAAQDSINDVVTPCGVIRTLCLHFLNLWWTGGLVAGIVFILISGFQIDQNMMNALIGGQPDRDRQQDPAHIGAIRR